MKHGILVSLLYRDNTESTFKREKQQEVKTNKKEVSERDLKIWTEIQTEKSLSSEVGQQA